MENFDFDDGVVYQDLSNKKSKFCLISYLWGWNNVNKGSIHKLTYGQQVERLIADCKKNKVNYYFVRYTSLEVPGTNYQLAIALKPKFIKHCLDKLKMICAYVDSDLRVQSYPHAFDLEADCWFVNWNEFDFSCYNPLQIELPGGVMAFANNDISRRVLDILTDSLDPKYAEDKTFSGIITRYFLNTFARCVWLPSTYLYMFDKHTYEPGQGYTKVVSYRKELEDTKMKQKDLVLVHEDFETGSLDDVFFERVKHDRYPPTTDKYLGEKLRCYDVKFKIYNNWGLDKRQAEQYRFDWEEKQSDKVAEITSIKPLKPQQFKLKKKLSINKSNKFAALTVIDNATDPKDISKFKKYCKKNNVPYVLCEVSSTQRTNLAYLILQTMKRIKRNVLYLDIKSRFRTLPKDLNETQMDFMCYNLNTDFKASGCYDPRILKTLNGEVMYFANNDLTKQFLQVWGEHNIKTYQSNKLQHKSLEYAFNVSGALNKMRCYWLSTKEIKSILRVPFFNGHTYKGVAEKSKILRRSMEQCGTKPSRNDDNEPRRAHHSGSKTGKMLRRSDMYNSRFKN